MSTYDVIAPVFVLVGVGYGALRFGLCSPAVLAGLSQFVFNVAVPALLFRSMAQRGVQATSGFPLLVAYYLPALAVFALGLGLSRLLTVHAKTRVVVAMGGSYGNCALLGIPLVLEAFGPAAGAPFFLLLAVHGPLLMTVAAVAFEAAEGQAAGHTKTLQRAAAGLAQNPIVLALLAGSLASALSLSLPKTLDETLSLLGRAAVPCALFALGGSLTEHRSLARVGVSLSIVALKQVALPAAVWLACGWLGIASLERKVATLMAAMPTGVNVFLFADRYRADVAIASTSVLLSTAASVPGLWWLLTWLDG